MFDVSLEIWRKNFFWQARMFNKSVLIAGRGGALSTPGVSVFPVGCVSGNTYILYTYLLLQLWCADISYQPNLPLLIHLER